MEDGRLPQAAMKRGHIFFGWTKNDGSRNHYILLREQFFDGWVQVTLDSQFTAFTN